jgi:transcriptional/translational regulatory protein YebC/TACO1
LTTTSHMATETEQLKRNAEDQITRLITQLSDLEELREVRDNTSQRVWAGAWA